MNDWVFVVFIVACVVVIFWLCHLWDVQHRDSLAEKDSLEIAILKHGKSRGKE
jgi:hypothetical protein